MEQISLLYLTLCLLSIVSVGVALASLFHIKSLKKKVEKGSQIIDERLEDMTFLIDHEIDLIYDNLDNTTKTLHSLNNKAIVIDTILSERTGGTFKSPVPDLIEAKPKRGRPRKNPSN